MSPLPSDLAAVAWLAADDIARDHGIGPVMTLEAVGKSLEARAEWDRVSAEVAARINASPEEVSRVLRLADAVSRYFSEQP